MNKRKSRILTKLEKLEVEFHKSGDHKRKRDLDCPLFGKDVNSKLIIRWHSLY